MVFKVYIHVNHVFSSILKRLEIFTRSDKPDRIQKRLIKLAPHRYYYLPWTFLGNFRHYFKLCGDCSDVRNHELFQSNFLPNNQALQTKPW